MDRTRELLEELKAHLATIDHTDPDLSDEASVFMLTLATRTDADLMTWRKIHARDTRAPFSANSI